MFVLNLYVCLCHAAAVAAPLPAYFCIFFTPLLPFPRLFCRLFHLLVSIVYVSLICMCIKANQFSYPCCCTFVFPNKRSGIESTKYGSAFNGIYVSVQLYICELYVCAFVCSGLMTTRHCGASTPSATSLLFFYTCFTMQKLTHM